MVLVVCAACDRFVRVSDARCPFCGAERTVASIPEPVAPRFGAPRLSRAALFLASSAAVTACGKTTEAPDSGRIREPDVYVAAPPYGQVPEPLPTAPEPPPPPVDAGYVARPPYGAPPPRRDAGKPRTGDPFDR